jgi:hypothetical protein
MDTWWYFVKQRDNFTFTIRRNSYNTWNEDLKTEVYKPPRRGDKLCNRNRPGC